MPDSRVIVGDCITVMRGMEAGSVQCCMTSPPYWGLRDYGTAEWEGGDAGCDHKAPLTGGKTKGATLKGAGNREGYSADGQYHGACGKCGARRIDQQLGLEPTPEAYIAKMVEVFAEVKRVLRDDGVLFLNVGDSYAANWNSQRKEGGAGFKDNERKRNKYPPPGLKPKDLCMMPSRLALALQADGWWVRSRLPWLKRSCMPEACTDRPTSAIEYVFLLTKSARYFWDAEAVRVKSQYDSMPERRVYGGKYADSELSAAFKIMAGGRNYRNSDLFYESLKAPHGMIFADDEPVALDVTPEAFKQAHFATFPRKLVTPLIRAATSEKGCCPECGAPWKRVVETSTEPEGLRNRGSGNKMDYHTRQTGSGQKLQDWKDANPSRTIGWEPGCMCGEHDGEPEDTEDVRYWEPIPCTVCDPFCGSGTVGVVAKQLGLSFIGIELNPDYAKMAGARIANPEPEPVVADVEGQRMLFEEK